MMVCGLYAHCGIWVVCITGEVLVKVAATGICHTDLVTKNLGFGPFPIVLGHEGSGVVEVCGVCCQ